MTRATKYQGHDLHNLINNERMIGFSMPQLVRPSLLMDQLNKPNKFEIISETRTLPINHELLIACSSNLLRKLLRINHFWRSKKEIINKEYS